MAEATAPPKVLVEASDVNPLKADPDYQTRQKLNAMRIEDMETQVCIGCQCRYLKMDRSVCPRCSLDWSVMGSSRYHDCSYRYAFFPAPGNHSYKYGYLVQPCGERSIGGSEYCIEHGKWWVARPVIVGRLG